LATATSIVTDPGSMLSVMACDATSETG
jgi:hypothetical protein